MNIVRDFNKDAATWDENPGRVKVAQKIAASIISTSMLDKRDTLMDFGCGTGLVSLALEPHVDTITGVDSSRGMLDVFNNKIKHYAIDNVTTALVDIDKSDLPSGPFSSIVSSMTMHHIKDIPLLLKKLHVALDKKGKLFIADLDSENGTFHENNDGVFHFGFERNELSSLLADAGFGSIAAQTAAEIHKPDSQGRSTAFTVFLLTAVKNQ
jgi:cyclopropane fatty-acyl-phospholipid synthase-like methyltransferase